MTRAYGIFGARRACERAVHVLRRGRRTHWTSIAGWGGDGGGATATDGESIGEAAGEVTTVIVGAGVAGTGPGTGPGTGAGGASHLVPVVLGCCR
jgi:hypothetical protein